jgi:hypothetical protein
MESEAFHDRWWEHLLCRDLDIDDPEPEWFDDVALGQISVTSPHTEHAFRGFNTSLPYEQRIRPWNFCSLVHLTREARAATGIRCLVAPFERDTGKLPDLDWIDRNDRGHLAHQISSGRSMEVEGDRVPVQTYRDYFEEYRLHPEAKALAPDGKRCHPWTRDPLGPARVHATQFARIGKESNPLTQATDFILETNGRAVEYRELRCRTCRKQLSGKQQYWCSDACRKRVGRSQKSCVSPHPQQAATPELGHSERTNATEF